VKRFYKQVSVEPTPDDTWRVLLDGRGIKTAGGRPQAVPTRALAEALAAEWATQAETIEPTTFRYRDLADYAIDVVAGGRETVITELLPYAETDTLCYRADPDEALYKRQLEVWEPLLSDTEAQLGVQFIRVSGIVHKAQPAATLARLRSELDRQGDYALAALKMLSSLASSLIIALAALAEDADAQALWRAANLEEDWQVELWGDDWEAAERRTARLAAFELAMDLARLARVTDAPD
jgi:chaperone required for assembly of F1-ATPase